MKHSIGPVVVVRADLWNKLCGFCLNINSQTLLRLVNLPGTCQGVPLASRINTIHCPYGQAAVCVGCVTSSGIQKEKGFFSVQQHTRL